ncbi:hypothetical protein L345_15956, partial [Ophiophagus hannah]
MHRIRITSCRHGFQTPSAFDPGDPSFQGIPVHALVDSGAITNFMDVAFTAKYATSQCSVEPPLLVETINGQVLLFGPIKATTQHLHLTIGSHEEEIQFYLTSGLHFPVKVTLEAIHEVETLPQEVKHIREQQIQLHPQLFSQQIKVSVEQGHVRTPSPKPRFKSYAYTQTAYVMSSDQKGMMFPPQHFESQEQKLFATSPMSSETDLESYQTALEEVLSWLLSAEDSLQAQGEISTDIEEVKEQFHTHEGFMMELTAHQGRVGDILQVGSQLLGTFGKLSEDEENEIQEQMNILNSRWENLRVRSMERQNKRAGKRVDRGEQESPLQKGEFTTGGSITLAQWTSKQEPCGCGAKSSGNAADSRASSKGQESNAETSIESDSRTMVESEAV